MPNSMLEFYITVLSQPRKWLIFDELMGFLAFFMCLCCCRAAKQEKDIDESRRRALQKYKVEDLQRELDVLGVPLSDDGKKQKSKKKLKRELRKLLIKELRRVDLKEPEVSTGATKVPMATEVDPVVKLNGNDTEKGKKEGKDVHLDDLLEQSMPEQTSRQLKIQQESSKEVKRRLPLR